MPSASEIPAFVICLERKPVSETDVQKWKAVFPNFTIYRAVDAEELDIDTDERVHALARMHTSFGNTVANDSIFCVPTPGAIGCFLSHHNLLLHECVERDRPIIVIEQDATFSQQCADILPDALRFIPKNAHYVSLMYIQQNHTRPHNKYFRRLVGPQCDGNQCYYVTPEGARRILKHALPIVTQFDLLIGVVAHIDQDFRGYVLNERLYSMWRVFSDNLGSSIQSFAVKKYLPRSNSFYYIILCLIFVLLFYAVHNLTR